MKNYTEIKFKISPVASLAPDSEPIGWDDATDVLSAQLADIGFETFEKDKPYLMAYIPSSEFDPDVLRTTVFNYPFQQQAIIENKGLREIAGQDWNSEWEKNYFKPYVFRDNKCVIHSSFHTGYPECEYDIIIDPKMAFGTGHHSTTRLMVEALLDADVKGKKIMDVGTGSAILAILASKLEAKEVLAVEIDEAAYVNAQENILLNHCSNIKIVHGDVYHIADGLKFDIILANINRNVIMDDLPEYVRYLSANGNIFLSGFYTHDIVLIEERAKQCGLKIDYAKEDNDWAMLCLNR